MITFLLQVIFTLCSSSTDNSRGLKQRRELGIKTLLQQGVCQDAP